MSTSTATQAASAVHPLVDMSVTLSARSSTLSTHRCISRSSHNYTMSEFGLASFARKSCTLVKQRQEFPKGFAPNVLKSSTSRAHHFGTATFQDAAAPLSSFPLPVT